MGGRPARVPAYNSNGLGIMPDADAAAETPIQIGENFSGPFQMREALTMQAMDLVMPDLHRIGSVTGWLQAAALAQAFGVEMSSHLFPCGRA